MKKTPNLVKQRRVEHAVCPRCHHPDYIMIPPESGVTIKPTFRCVNCNYPWSCGQSGGKYGELAKGSNEKTTP